jgi:hypothetical protein
VEGDWDADRSAPARALGRARGWHRHRDGQAPASTARYVRVATFGAGCSPVDRGTGAGRRQGLRQLARASMGGLAHRREPEGAGAVRVGDSPHRGRARCFRPSTRRPRRSTPGPPGPTDGQSRRRCWPTPCPSCTTSPDRHRQSRLGWRDRQAALVRASRTRHRGVGAARTIDSRPRRSRSRTHRTRPRHRLVNVRRILGHVGRSTSPDMRVISAACETPGWRGRSRRPPSPRCSGTTWIGARRGGAFQLPN